MLHWAILHSQLLLLGHWQQGSPQLQGLAPQQQGLCLMAAGIAPHSPPPAQATSPITPSAGPQCSAAPTGAAKINTDIQVTKNFKRTPGNSLQEAASPHCSHCQTETKPPLDSPYPSSPALSWGSVLGSGHEWEEDVTSNCSCRMSPPEPPASAEPKELPKVTRSRGPQTAAQSKKDKWEMVAFCLGATGPTSQQGQGLMWPRCQAGLSSSLQLQLHPSCSEILDPLFIVLEPLVRGCSRRGPAQPQVLLPVHVAQPQLPQHKAGLVLKPLS